MWEGAGNIYAGNDSARLLLSLLMALWYCWNLEFLEHYCWGVGVVDGFFGVCTPWDSDAASVQRSLLSLLLLLLVLLLTLELLVCYCGADVSRVCNNS